MRPSNKKIILVAAAAVVQREGVTSLTLESVAEEAGLTKGGLMYHFPTRDALLQAVHEHLAEQWDADMVKAAGHPAGEVDRMQRLRAYIQVATHSATRAELLFMLEGATSPDLMSPWTQVIQRWAPPAPRTTAEHDQPVDQAHEDTGDAAPGGEALTAFIARLAADGLWMHESLTGIPLPPALRARITRSIMHIAETAGPGVTRPDEDTKDRS